MIYLRGSHIIQQLWYRERQQQLDELRKNLEKVQEEADILRSQLRTVQKRTQVLVQEWVQATNSVSRLQCRFLTTLLRVLLNTAAITFGFGVICLFSGDQSRLGRIPKGYPDPKVFQRKLLV